MYRVGRSLVCRTMAAWVLLGLVLGCGKKVDLGKAEKSVETALNRWKEGGKPADLADQKIDIADPDWSAGKRLLDYQVKSTSELPQQGPRVVVVLELQDKKGKKTSSEVAYEVIPGDPLRIGRDAFHVPN